MAGEAGARKGPYAGAEGPLCRAGLGLGPKGPNPSRVDKSGPVGFGPEGPKPNRPRLGDLAKQRDPSGPCIGALWAPAVGPALT